MSKTFLVTASMEVEIDEAETKEQAETIFWDRWNSSYKQQIELTIEEYDD